ncbi:MAG TPA: helix-turn-helix domain-containing protein [Polyangiaceae bacterium]|nr:helix-turn-helix domain-containing protein [Polyangiaceae bacterium]
MIDVQVIEDPRAAAVALDPVRRRLLAELAEPASAATLASRLGIARQKVNYHLRALETHGMVREADTRQWGGLTERLLVANAASYVVSPSALGPAACDPAHSRDRLSAAYLIALSARVIRELGALLRGAAANNKRVATLSVDAEVRFRNAEERARFTEELARAVTSLVGRYHDASTPGGRSHRLIVMAHPVPTTREPKEVS